jgi:hypothetical protein
VLHSRGINLCHLGLLRGLFWRKCAGRVSVVARSRAVKTSHDLRSELTRGSTLMLAAKRYHISPEPSDELGPAVRTFSSPIEQDAGSSKRHAVLEPFAGEVADVNSLERCGRLRRCCCCCRWWSAR